MYIVFENKFSVDWQYKVDIMVFLEKSKRYRYVGSIVR